MSYILNDGPPRTSRRRPALFIGGGIVLITLMVAAFLVGRDDGTPGTKEPAPSVGAPVAPVVTWSVVGDQPVPASPSHGPARTEGGLASGFSHDELGAVLAAINISTRLAGQAGPVVYESTARMQCFGDVDGTIASIRNQRSSAVPGSTVPGEVLYRITSGDPASDLVAISVALATPQSRSMGGFAELTRTLQWIDGDWKVQVPPAPPRLVTSVAGYASLGHPDA